MSAAPRPLAGERVLGWVLVLAVAIICCANAAQPTTNASHAPARNAPTQADYDELIRRRLALPVAGVKANSLRDSFVESRSGGQPHEALDIPAASGTPVVATEAGTIVKLFNSKPGGLTVYQFDPSRTYCYYYAHLDRYAEAVKEGTVVRPGEVIGYVGTTGNASSAAPHLHFAIFKLGPEKRWWQGVALNPYPILVQR